jgi:spermidine/putrescine transport system substrate-binding protein
MELFMKRLTSLLISLSVAVLAGTGAARAAGELQLYNWGNYTSPELIKKFEETYNVKVTITNYDSNDTALAKIREGNHGFDLVVPSANFIPIFAAEGLLQETGAATMSNFKNIDPRWVDVSWDPGRKWSVPWLWGSTGLIVDTSVYKGDINTSAIFLNPPKELTGKVRVAPEMNDVIFTTIKYVGGDWCTSDPTVLKKVEDTLVNASKKWIENDNGMIENFAARDYGAAFYWSGGSLRAREENPDVRFGYPREGYPVFMDSVAILKEAKNVDNAKLFLNFIMDPVNAAMMSNYAKFANGIKGSEAYMLDELKTAPELVVPQEFQAAGQFLLACPPHVNELYTKIWAAIGR